MNTEDQIRNLEQDIDIIIPSLEEQIIPPDTLIEKLKEVRDIIEEHMGEKHFIINFQKILSFCQ